MEIPAKNLVVAKSKWKLRLKRTADPSYLTLESTPLRPSSRAARSVTWTILGVNALLLMISLPDYRAVIDSGYHISLARWYAAHGTAWWDHINYGPGGRPNLQGPALHVAIAILGRMLGGKADSFILANAILGFIQWSAALLTVLYFARRLGGDTAAMFAVALLAGSASAAASFYVGIPSGWLFISIPWAIYFFLENRLMAAALITSAACYVHLGGFLAAPFGILIAAILERRWRALIVVGLATAMLTSPYSIHFLTNLAWYRGQHGHEAAHFDPLTDLLAIAGAIWFFRYPTRHKFLLAWAAAPVSWLVQDPSRFVLQSTLAGSVIAGLFLAAMMDRLAVRAARVAFATVLVVLATIFPLGVPSLVAEASWDAGLHFPLFEDWDQARGLARIIDDHHLNNRLLAVYASSFGPSIAVFTPVVVRKGHWVEVQPRHDPGDDLSAGAQTYVVPLGPDDSVLLSMSQAGLVQIYGGTSDSSVIDMLKPANPQTIAPVVSQILADNADWLADNAINNKMPPRADLVKLLSKKGQDPHRARMDRQRFRAGRMEIACLVYAYAVENESPKSAYWLRGVARGFAEMAGFISDDNAVGFMSDARFGLFKRNLHAFAAAVRAGGPGSLDGPAVGLAAGKLLDDFFGGAA